MTDIGPNENVECWLGRDDSPKRPNLAFARVGARLIQFRDRHPDGLPGALPPVGPAAGRRANLVFGVMSRADFIADG
jgi:hypothetical protein